MNIDDTSYMLLLKTCITPRKIVIILHEQRQNNSGVLSRSKAIIVLRAHHTDELFPDAILYAPL